MSCQAAGFLRMRANAVNVSSQYMPAIKKTRPKSAWKSKLQNPTLVLNAFSLRLCDSSCRDQRRYDVTSIFGACFSGHVSQLQTKCFQDLLSMRAFRDLKQRPPFKQAAVAGDVDAKRLRIYCLRSNAGGLLILEDC